MSLLSAPSWALLYTTMAVPLTGEALDVMVLANSESSTGQKLVAGVSLAYSVFTLGIGPNYGAVDESVKQSKTTRISQLKTWYKRSRLASERGSLLVGKNAPKNVLGKAPNPKSRKQFGHTFETHGAGTKNTNKLKGRAGGTGDNQGQWLNNQKAADFLSQHADITTPKVVDIPEGIGQVIKPDGSIVPATKAQLVPKPDGGFRSAYPIE